MLLKIKMIKFYYLENDVLKTIAITEGAYEIKDINAILQHRIPKKSIKLVVDQDSAKCKIFLKQGYKIDFSHNDTFKNILGFDAVKIDQPFTESSKICNLVISTNIYIHLYIFCKSIFKKNRQI